MRLFSIDFETYWDHEYSLKKLTTEEYIRGERFEILGCAVVGEGMREWMRPNQLKEQCESWSHSCANGGEPIALVAHHAHFDGLILNLYLDYRPSVWLDTLSMGRVVFGSGLRLGLDHLAEYFGLAPKNVPYHLFEGKRWHEIPSWDQNEIAEGSIHDAELTLQCCQYMLSGGHPAVPYTFPLSEIPVVDLTIRMFTEPCLVGDIDALAMAWTVENNQRNDLFARLSRAMGLEITDEMLRKDQFFADLLDMIGVEPEKKTTAKGNIKYAFAKTDPFMQDLLIHPAQDVVLLAEARLKAHSSIYTSRVERFGFIATRGAIPIYLGYSAAHTRRWGGGDRQNAQNLPRPDPYKPQKGALRRAIKAP